MKFKLLLFILLKKMQGAAKKNPAFKKFIKDKNLKMNIKTADNKNGRQYIFNNGKITSRSGVQEDSVMSMVWCDAETGFKTMSSPNEEAPVAALTEQKLVIEGKFKEFAWFSRSLDIMMGKA